MIGSAAIYSLSNIVNAGVPFLMLPVLTRLLGPADYGMVAMFTTTVTMLGAFVGLNIHGAVGIRYFQQEQYHLPSYIRTALAVLLASVVVVGAVVLLGQEPIAQVTGLPALWLCMAVLAAAAQFLGLVLLVLFQMQNKPLSYGAFRILQSLTDAGLSLWFVAGIGLAWQGRALGQLTAVCLFGVVTLVLLQRGGWLAGGVRREYVSNLLRFGVPLIPHTIGGLLIALCDRYIVNHLLGADQAGIYMVALQLAMALSLLADAFAKAFSPWLNQQLKSDDAQSRLRVVGAIYLAIIGFLIMGGMALAVLPFVFDLLLPANYVGAKEILPYFVAGNAFLGMYYSVTNLVFFSAQTYRISRITLGVAIVSVAATYFLVDRIGLQGAGLTYAASQFLLFILVWREGAKLFSLPWGSAAESIRVVLRRG